MQRIEFSKRQTEDIASRYLNGETKTSIGKVYHVSKTTIANLLKQNDIGNRGLRPKKQCISKIPKGTPIDCNIDGEQCKYHAAQGSCYTCDYLFVVGHSRSCPADRCTVWEVRRKGRKNNG